MHKELQVRLATIGFTKSSAEHFFERLREAKVARLIDVRLHNTSQMSGFSKKTDLSYFLRELCAIDYLHRPMLAPTPKLLARYQAKMITWPEYEREFRQLIRRRRAETSVTRDLLDNSVLLCSEASPEWCHRRLLAEYLQTKFEDLVITHL
jgi:uncharacterized protein (DUF488 family)